VAQITIYLDEETMTAVRAGSRAAKVSRSQWIAEAVRVRAGKEWPASVRALAGAWPDFPSAEQIRRRRPSDNPREKL
jgi:hypothetical protein